MTLQPSPLHPRLAPWLGAGLFVVVHLTVVGTVVVQHRRWTSTEVLAGVLGVGLAVLLVRVAPWSRRDRRWLLVWPGFMVVTLGVAPEWVGAAAGLYGGFFTLAFLFVGVTQPPRTALWLTGPAVIAWSASVGVHRMEDLVRLPVALVVWALVAEVPARLVVRLESLTRTLGTQAETDLLTGLANRRMLRAALDGLRSSDAVVILDLDHFKRINDDHGHTEGDAVLADLGRTVLECVRAGDVCVRYGGEEVLLVLKQSGTAGADSALRRISARWHELRPGITFSAGVAEVTEPVRPREVLARADAALRGAKRAGRDRWLVHAVRPDAAAVVARPRQRDGSVSEASPARGLAGRGT